MAKWFDRLFRRPPKDATLAPTMNGLAPIFPQYGTDIYAYDVVQQVLQRIVTEIKKLKPRHVRYNDNYDPIPVKGNIQDVLNNPNPLMTTTDFLEKVTYLLLLNSNAFIIPVYYTWIDDKTGAERRYYEALYPVNPTQVNFIHDQSGTMFVEFVFANGDTTTIPYDDVIHLRYRFSINELMGGNELGQPEYKGLLQTLHLNDDMLKGIAKAMNASYSVNGIVKYNTLIGKEQTDQALQQLTQMLQNSQSGIVGMDIKSDYTPLERKSEIIDTSALEFIDSKVTRTWSMARCILSGDYTKEQYEAFYQSAIEDKVGVFTQSFTKGLFTVRQRAFGNRIEFYPKDLVFMSQAQIIEVINTLAPTGALFENEKRHLLGLAPEESLVGKRYMSLNWIEADKASQYQVGKINVDVVDEDKTVTEE